MRVTTAGVVVVVAVGLLLGCAAEAPVDPSPEGATTKAVEWALAIHGGAGNIPRDADPERLEAIEAALSRLRDAGAERLATGVEALDVVEEIAVELEDDPLFNAGRGAVLTSERVHELDAAIMDGRTHACGAVAGLRSIQNPIRLARAVMESSPHVFMIGEGAERFADEQGFDRVANDYFTTERRVDSLEEVLAEREAAGTHGTVGVVARDRRGNLAAATSTGGMTAKRFGRVGDVPVIGAGTWADNATCAVSASGHGEEFIRHGAAQAISARMALAGMDLESAAREVIGEVLAPGDGGVIAVGADGSISVVFSTTGFYHATADATGRRGFAIWND